MTNYFARWAEYTAWSKTVKAMVETAQEAARKMLKELPSAQPEQGWIPCSERLPEEEVDVLVSGWDIDYDTSLINTGYMKRGKWETEESYEYGHEIRVDAWQPLPEPYMEENNG